MSSLRSTYNGKRGRDDRASGGISDVTKQLREGEVERFGNLLKINQCNIPLASFDTADIGPIQSTQVGECLLRDSHLTALLAQRPTEPDSDVHLRFGVMLCLRLFMCPRTMSIISVGSLDGLS